MELEKQMELMQQIEDALNGGSEQDRTAALDAVRTALIKKDLVFNPKDTFFDVVRIHRDDLKAKGFDGDKVDDKTMEQLASKMGDIMVEYDFWDILPDLCENYGIPRLEEDDDEL